MNFDFEIGEESKLMSRSKSSKLSAGCKLVQRHRVVRVNEKKFLFSIFLNFLSQTAKKFALSRDTSFSTGLQRCQPCYQKVVRSMSSKLPA